MPPEHESARLLTTPVAPPGARTVLTISATFGAGGTIVGPEVAKRLQLPYLERLITPVVAARHAAIDLEEVLNAEERVEGLWSRVLDAVATMPAIFGTTMPDTEQHAQAESRLRDRVEATIRQITRDRGGVIVGRGATWILTNNPNVFRVRLDGPRNRRVAQAMRWEGLKRDEAERRLTEVDRARAAYVRRFYGCDVGSPSHYHLVLDSTLVPLEVCAQVITRAASAAWQRLAEERCA